MTLTAETAYRKDIRSAKTANGNWPGVLQHRHFAFIAGVIKAMPDHAPSLRAQKLLYSSGVRRCLRRHQSAV